MFQKHCGSVTIHIYNLQQVYKNNYYLMDVQHKTTNP